MAAYSFLLLILLMFSRRFSECIIGLFLAGFRRILKKVFTGFLHGVKLDFTAGFTVRFTVNFMMGFTAGFAVNLGESR